MRIKKYILPILLFVFFIFLVYKDNIERYDNLTARKGVLDLSASPYNIKDSIFLDGDWAFYWKKFITFNENSSPDGYFPVPAEWSSYNLNGNKIPEYGYASYRLIIKGLKDNHDYGLKLREAGTAYSVYINGELLGSQGRAGKDKLSSKPEYKPQTIFFHGKPETEIIIHFSNYYHRAAGIWYSIKLGDRAEIVAEREKKIGLEMFLVGMLIIMGMYYISIFILRRNEISALYFGLFCLIIASRTLVTGENYFESVIRDISWENARKIEYISMYFTIPIFALFIYSLFPKYTSKLLIAASALVTAFYTVFTLITEVSIYSRYLYIAQLFLLICIVSIIVSLLTALIKKESNSGIILYGFLFIIVAILNDIVASYSLIQSDFIMPLGTLIFIFCQSLVLTIRFAGAFTTVEKLADENMKMYKEIAELNHSLERKVEERTSELSNTIRTLTLTQEKLIATEKMASLGKIAGGIAHELNSPLGAVITNAQILKEDFVSIENAEKKYEWNESVDLILSATSKARNTISNLLKYSAAAGHKNELVVIDDIIKNILLIYEKNVEDAQITVETSIENNLVVNGEKTQIFGVIDNIFKNAVKSLKEKGKNDKKIVVKSYCENGNAVIEIYDNGKGLSSEAMERIFEPFVVGENDTHGLRFGLNISNDIIRKYNGELKIDSVEGEFALFKITFKKGDTNE